MSIYGCTSKFEVRINPQNPQAIQTPDPDLRSRPIQTSRSRPMIQTSCFILFGFVDPDPLFYFGVNMLDPAPSLPLWLDCGLEGHAVQLLAAASLLLAAAQLEHFGSRPVTKIWSKSAYPVPDLVPHRSRPVPDRSRSFPDRSMESNLMEEEFSGQCKIIWCFWGRIHTDYHDSIHSVPDVRNRRFTKVAVPDVRITAERSRPVYWCIAIYIFKRDTCLYIHSYIYIRDTCPYAYKMSYTFQFFPWKCNSNLVELSWVLHKLKFDKASLHQLISILNPHQAHDGPRYNFSGVCHDPGVGGNHGHHMAQNTSAGRWGESRRIHEPKIKASKSIMRIMFQPTNDVSEFVHFGVQVGLHDW